MKRSSAATTAAASSGEAFGATIVSFGRRFIVTPRVSCAAVPELPVLDHDAVLAAVSPADAIERVREALLRFHAGDWVMPPKVYLDSPPFGDFRAMPARGDGLALLKWVTSFPGNPARGLPTVTGVICLSDADDRRAADAARRALGDRAAHRRRRRGGGAGARPPDARTVGIVGCGLHGAWTARCLAAAGYGPGVCSRPARGGRAGARRRARLGRRLARRRRCAATSSAASRPAREIVIDAGDLRPGLHLNMLGADGPGKAEASVGAVASCALFCDEWEQASHGGELTGAVEAGLVSREQVTELGAVLAGDGPGAARPEAVTLFDSTGLAIQDLAVARGGARGVAGGAGARRRP